MTVFIITMVRPSIVVGVNRLFRLLGACLDEVARHFIRRAAVANLRGLDDRALRDIGLLRSQIEALHWSRNQEIDTRFCDSTGHVLFVGDSAHAMAPTLGQGATQAIEDGCAFLSLFATYYDNGFNAPALTSAYDRLRRERIEFVKSFSWDASEPLLAGSDPVASNRRKLKPDYRSKLRRLYSDIALAAQP